MLHTDIPSRNDIEHLSGVRGDMCVSIYLPTTPVSQDVDHDRLVLKNLTRTGLGQMREGGSHKKDVDAIDEAIDDLLDDGEFWSLQANSLAIFVTPEGLQSFRLPNKLEPMVEVADRFHIKPLLRAVTVPQSAFVLALAQGSVRLVEVSPDMPAYSLAVPEIPTDVASAAGKASITDRSMSGRIQGSEGQKVRMRQYARKVDQALRELLSGRETPLILAAAPPIDSIFRSVNTYPFLADEGIEGNPEKLTDAELASGSRAILDRLHEAKLEELGALFETRVKQSRTTSDVAEAAKAATFGAIAVLFVDIDAVVPGFVDEQSGSVEFHDSSGAEGYGVIDEIARRSLASGAQVLGVREEQVPGGGSVAAILRYPLV